jgi:putative transposase
MIISLYAGGMTVRDIQHHLARTLGTELSHDTISAITDQVLEQDQGLAESAAGGALPDHLPGRAGGGRSATATPCATGPRTWPSGWTWTGSSTCWGSGCRPARARSSGPGCAPSCATAACTGVLIVCCDGLTGFPEAIEATWPQATVQTCVVHLIRAAMRFVSYADRKKIAAALRPIYTAPTIEAAETELLAFADSDLGRRYPATVATWEHAWERFIPFLGFPPELRKIIYTTNTIESLNYQLRKIIKNRGHFPNDDAAIKLLWLAIRDIEDKRARTRAKQQGLPKNQRNAPGRLIEGATTQGWKAALGALALAYPDRLNPYLT